MNKKILILSLSLLMVISVVLVIVMTQSEQKLPATAEPTNSIPDMGTLDVETDNGIVTLNFLNMTGPITLTLDETVIEGTFVDICAGTYDPGTNKGVYTFEEVWTFDGGTFDGTADVETEGNLLGGQYTRMTTQIILHGTGVYEGQTLDLSSDEAGGFPCYTGYWLKS